mmetsp:Transcript_30797/g.69127  ORF Transcript_30797/g.69127 Transcript_30797/m.69127 type:complete len:268 (-) Transcript_30797:154-957(-)
MVPPPPPPPKALPRRLPKGAPLTFVARRLARRWPRRQRGRLRQAKTARRSPEEAAANPRPTRPASNPACSLGSCPGRWMAAWLGRGPRRARGGRRPGAALERAPAKARQPTPTRHRHPEPPTRPIWLLPRLGSQRLKGWVAAGGRHRHRESLARYLSHRPAPPDPPFPRSCLHDWHHAQRPRPPFRQGRSTSSREHSPGLRSDLGSLAAGWSRFVLSGTRFDLTLHSTPRQRLHYAFPRAFQGSEGKVQLNGRKVLMRRLCCLHGQA